MSISKRLMVIVLLTLVEVSITVWAAIQISKGATFHQLNSLHLKYNVQFLDQVVALGADPLPEATPEQLSTLERTILDIRQQPVDCLAEAGWIDRQLMRAIDTDQALELCRKDIKDADQALRTLDAYRAGKLWKAELVGNLRTSADHFAANSAAFEGPVTETVDFIFRTMIPMIIVISAFNISFITYLSRTISQSIREATNLLRKDTSEQTFAEQLRLDVSGELQELLQAAHQRIERDLLNLDTNSKLQAVVDTKTASLRLANEELESFAYRTSHDLKGPLTRSRRLCQFVKEDVGAGNLQEAAKNVSVIEAQLSGLEHLVEDLMSLARADLSSSEKEVLDVRLLVKTIFSQQQLATPEPSVVLQMDVEPPGEIVSERIRLSQIFDNLFSNGLKYADRSQSCSWIKVMFRQLDDVYQMIIEDNGIGFPEEVRHEVFKPFKRFHPEMHSGSGLGLSIVNKQVAKLGGRVEYEPCANGSRFIILLPRIESSTL